jgi:hypothetical protein
MMVRVPAAVQLISVVVEIRQPVAVLDVKTVTFAIRPSVSVTATAGPRAAVWFSVIGSFWLWLALGMELMVVAVVVVVVAVWAVSATALVAMARCRCRRWWWWWC